MSEENSGQDSQANKERNPGPSSRRPTPKLPDNSGSKIGTQEGAGEPKNSQPLRVEVVKGDSLTAFEKRMFWLTVAGVILAVVTGYIFYRQFREMSAQTAILSQQAKTAHDDSVDAGKKADAQIAALRGQVAAAQEAVRLAAKDSAQNGIRIERQLKLLQSQSEAARDQADAALKSAIAIQKQTDISERPWLSVEATPVNGLIFVNGQQAVLVLKLSIRNVGKSIAKDIQADAKLFPAPPGMPIALDAGVNQRELCSHPKTDPIGRFDLFPVDHPTDRELDISAIPSAIAAQSVTYPGEKPRSFVGFYVVGCVTYHSSFGMEMHQTRFGYRLIGPQITSSEGTFLILPNGTPVMMDFEVGVDVPQGKVGFMHEIFSRNDAN